MLIYNVKWHERGKLELRNVSLMSNFELKARLARTVLARRKTSQLTSGPSLPHKIHTGEEILHH